MASRQRQVATLVTVVDQALYGFTSFLTVVIAARMTTPDDFGRFAAVYTVAVIWLALARTLLAEGPLVQARTAGRPEIALCWMSRGAIDGAALSALAALGAAAVVGADGLIDVLAFAVGIGSLVFHDIQRYALVQSDRGHRAVASEVVWLAALVATIPTLAANPGLQGLFILWLLPAVPSALVIAPGPRLLARLLRTKAGGRGMGTAIAGETVLALMATALPISLCAVVVGPAAAGQLRLVQSSVAPPSILVDVVRKRQTLAFSDGSGASPMNATLQLLGVASVIAVSLGTILWLWSDAVFGPAQRVPVLVTAPLLLGFVARVAGTPAFISLRVRGAVRSTITVRLGGLGLAASGLVIGAFTGSGLPVAFSIGLAAMAANAGAVWLNLRFSDRHHVPTSHNSGALLTEWGPGRFGRREA